MDTARQPFPADPAGAPVSAAPTVPASPSTFPSTLPRLLRHFPYTEMLVLFMPVYAQAWVRRDSAHTPSLGMLIPFICTFAVGFIYNDLNDLRDPSYKQNPILTGAVSRPQAQAALCVFLTTAVLSFLFFFRNISSLLLFALYVTLCFAYSGLGVRLKERTIGPLVASYIIWIGGPLIVAVETRVFSRSALLFAGAWLVYTGRELHHMISDYLCDVVARYRTLIVRMGISRGRLLEHIAFIAGALILVLDARARFAETDLQTNWKMICLIVSIVGAASIQLLLNPLSHKTESRVAYWCIRLALVFMAACILDASAASVVLVAWAFVTSARS